MNFNEFKKSVGIAEDFGLTPPPKKLSRIRTRKPHTIKVQCWCGNTFKMKSNTVKQCRDCGKFHRYE